MRSIFHSLTTGLLAATMLWGGAAGCGSATAAETDLDLSLSRLPVVKDGDGELLWARPGTEQVNCIRAPCPSNMIYEVNTGQNQLVYAYDWRALNLSDGQQAKLQALASQLLIRGRYAVLDLGGGGTNDPPLKVFQVIKVQQRAGRSVDAPDADQYYTIRASEPSCESPPCPPFSAIPLNREFDQAQQWNGIDTTALGLTADEYKTLADQIQKGDGYVSTKNAGGMPVILDAAFLPFLSWKDVTPPPQ